MYPVLCLELKAIADSGNPRQAGTCGRCFAAVKKFADRLPLTELEADSAGVKAVAPAESGQNDGSREKFGKICKHLNYREFMKPERNLGRGCEKSVKNPEKRLKFSANYCFI